MIDRFIKEKDKFKDNKNRWQIQKSNAIEDNK